MTRKKGTFEFSSNIESLKKAPLDARQMVDEYAELIDPSTWVDRDDNVWLFNGLIVGVANDPSTSRNGIYLLLDADNYTNTGSWFQAAGIGSTSTEGENVGTGDASVFKQKIGDTLQFRELKAGLGVTIDASGDLITIDASGTGAIYDSILDPSLQSLQDVGGYPAGTQVGDLLDDTFTQFVDELLFAIVNPTFVDPSNAFSNNVNYLQEIGDSINITFITEFNRGGIYIDSSLQNGRSGDASVYNYTGTGLPGTFASTDASNGQTVNGYTVLIGTQTWTNTVTYSPGPQPLNSRGTPFGSPLAGGTTSSKSTTLEGVYPIFATSSSISDPSTQQTLVSMLTGNNIDVSLAAESNGLKQSFDLPNPWIGAPTNRTLTGIQTYNSIAENWQYQGGNATQSLLYWDTSTFSRTIQGNPVNYTRYIYNGTDRSNIQIRLKF